MRVVRQENYSYDNKIPKLLKKVFKYNILNLYYITKIKILKH